MAKSRGPDSRIPAADDDSPRDLHPWMIELSVKPWIGMCCRDALSRDDLKPVINFISALYVPTKSSYGKLPGKRHHKMNDINMNDASNLEPILPVLDDIDFETYTDQELVELDAELSTKLSFIEIENMIFDSFLVRMLPFMNIEDPSDTGKTAEDGKDGDKGVTRREKKKKIGDKKEADRPFNLNFEQKNEIAIREMEELRDAYTKEKEEWAKVFDNFKVFFIDNIQG